MALRLAPGKYYGETLRARKISSFELSERIYPPGYETPMHTHKQALFCFVIEGGYTETFGRKTRECVSSTLLFHPPEEQHAERFHEAGGRSFIVELAPAWLPGILEHFPVADRSADFRGGVYEGLARKLYREFHRDDHASPLIIEGLIMEMVGETMRRGVTSDSPATPSWLGQAKELAQARFRENFSLADLAGEVGVHPVHLAQSFRKSFQCTIGEFVRQLRIEEACRELTKSTRPIVDIALAVGFCDQSHFTRTFKRATGSTPAEYRSAFRPI